MKQIKPLLLMDLKDNVLNMMITKNLKKRCIKKKCLKIQIQFL